MPLILSSAAIQEKNRLEGGAQTIVCLKIDVPGLPDPVRVCSDNANLTWKGETWVAFAFEVDEISDSSTGEIPRVDLRVANVNRIMGSYFKDYDDYIKVNGYSPVELTIYVVNRAAIAQNGSCAPEVEYLFDLKQQKADARWATLTLGAPNHYTRRFPLSRIMKSHCRYRFKDDRCAYRGEEAACSHTLARCRELGNSTRFGGAPGVGRGGITVE